MNISVELIATATVTLRLDKESVLEVMRDFNGDFEEFAKRNYHNYMDFDDFEVEYDDCRYNSEDADKLIKEAKDILCIDEDFNINRAIKHRTKLNSFVSDKPCLETIEKIFVDTELIAKTIDYTAFNDPKQEFNYIYLDKDTITATDKQRLIYITNHKYSDFNNDLLPPSFIEPLEKGAKLFRGDDGEIFMEFEKHWFCSDLSEFRGDVKFTDIQRILPKKESYGKMVNIPFKNFLSKSISKQIKAESYPKNLIEINYNGQDIAIQEIFYNDLKKLHKDLEAVMFSESSFVFATGENIQIAIMPATRGCYD